MTPTPKSASGGTARHGAVEQGKPQEAAGPFVLNLTSSTTPMALANPEQPELKRFSFFVSRRFEEGRERFRLHMGYFSTLAEAEEWLVAVRDIYPGAWAGEAPGKKLRERAVAAAAAQAQHAAGPPPPVAPPRNVPTLPVAQSASVGVPALNVPTIHAATPGPARRPATLVAAQVPRNVPVARPAPLMGQPAMLNSGMTSKPASAPARPPVAVSSSGPSVIGMMRSPKDSPPKAAPVVPVAAPRSVAPAQARSGSPLASVAPAQAAAARPPMAAVARAAAPAAVRTAPPVAQPARAAAAAGQQYKPAAPPAAARAHGVPTAPARPNAKANARATMPDSNVREVLKALGETSNDAEITGETRMMPAPSLAGMDTISDNNNFTDTQVLKFLETRRADGSELTGIDVETGAISLLKPDDTGTRRALKEAVTENAPVWFAVQLQWSVSPVELSKVPPLAIFSAYTLYTVEGSRDGRKWFGLRLGFFSDAISAKQVAYYVRSEFTSVAVVPVSPQERTRASDVEKKSDLAFPKRTRSEPVDEFKLIDSDDHDAPAPARPRPALATKPAAPAKTAPPAAARRPQPAKASNGRVRAREARTPQTLEETLEILGAGELEMDSGHGETMNESGVRHLRVEVQKNTPFGRLLERLSERVRKP
ncbi:MAG TPA: hypothetical protein VNO35_24010 [Steroidobacteraceae bacterium]|nr:hypothetical protein [Steroidobacteraceae bacterium]